MLRFFYVLGWLWLCLATSKVVAQTPTEGFARQHLQGTWVWRSVTRPSTVGGFYPPQTALEDERILVRIEKNKVTITKNGEPINHATLRLLEEDTRMAFLNWESGQWVIEDGTFDFEETTLILRGNTSERGSIWEFERVEDLPFAMPAPTPPPTTTTETPVIEKPAATPQYRTRRQRK